MDTITYSEARSKLADTMEKVCDDHAPMIITRKNGYIRKAISASDNVMSIITMVLTRIDLAFLKFSTLFIENVLVSLTPHISRPAKAE